MKITRYYQKVIILGLGIALTYIIFSCQSADSQNEKQENHTDYILSADTILLSEHSNIRPSLVFKEVEEHDHSMEFSTSGVVKTIPTAYAEIAAPFAGRVLKSFVKLGQNVNIGTPIFEISSPDYFNAQKDYFDSKQEFRQSELNLKRQQDLFKNAVGIQRELEEAETEYSIKKAALSNAAAALKIFNVNLEKVTLGQPLIVTSPIRGKLIRNNIVIGQYLKEDAEPIATVAELSKVWIAAQIKEKDMHFIQTLDEVEIKSAAYPQNKFTGKIFHINEIVNENTRSVEVLIECDNPGLELRSGMYVTLQFKNKPSKALLIPSEAIFQKEDQQFVFIKISDSHFEKRNIETAGISEDKTIVTAGLHKGDFVVAKGGFLLNKAY